MKFSRGITGRLNPKQGRYAPQGDTCGAIRGGILGEISQSTDKAQGTGAGHNPVLFFE
jgi:hypothetical protein